MRNTYTVTNCATCRHSEVKHNGTYCAREDNLLMDGASKRWKVEKTWTCNFFLYRKGEVPPIRLPNKGYIPKSSRCISCRDANVVKDTMGWKYITCLSKTTCAMLEVKKLSVSLKFGCSNHIYRIPLRLPKPPPTKKEKREATLAKMRKSAKRRWKLIKAQRL